MQNRQLEYLCQTEDGTFIYVSSSPHDVDNFWYDRHEACESFKLFVGNGTSMKEVPVQDVRRDSHDGTTLITTLESIFYWPSTYSRWEKPTWGDKDLTILNPDDYNIVEMPNLVIIEERHC